MDQSITVNQAKQLLALHRDEGMDCPCCDQFVKVYKRRIHSTMAKHLIQFYQHIRGTLYWSAHVRDFIDGHPGDFAKLAHWGLILSRGHTGAEDKKHSGEWYMSSEGKKFAEGHLVVPEFAYIYAGTKLRLEGRAVDIRDCLGKKYSYREVMSA